MTAHSTVEALGYRIASGGAGECVGAFSAWAREAPPARVAACLNPHSVATADRDADLSAALGSADLLLPDGVGVVLAARLAGGRVAGRVTGSDLLEGVCAALDAEGGRSCFFLGCTEEALSRVRARMARDFPRLRVAGTLSPPFAERFGADEEAAMVRAVNGARPDALWVGMTAPKQEKWIARNREALEVPAVAAVGAALDFFAGTARRPGPAMRRLGLEWLGRLAREPGRMWRRTLVSGPVFCGLVLRSLADGKGGGR